MVRCPDCGELIRYGAKKCFVCDYVLTEFDLAELDKQQAEHEEKLRHYHKLSIAAEIIERLATALLIVAMCLIFPTIGDFKTYDFHQEGYNVIREIRDEKKHDLMMLDKNDPKFEELSATMTKDLERINKRVESDERVGNRLLSKAILSTVLAIGSLVISIAMFITMKVLRYKRKKLL